MKKNIGFFSLIIFSISSIFSNFLNFIKICSVPFLLCFPAFYLKYYIVSETSLNKIVGMFIMSTGLFMMPMFFAFLTNWHRFIIFDGKKPWEFKLIEFSNNTLKFTIAAIIILIFITIPYAVLTFLSFYISAKFKLTFWIIPTTGWILMLLYFYLYSKLALIFPAAAAGHSISLKRVFTLSKGYFWKILGGFLTFIITSIIVKKIITITFGYSIYLSPFLFIIDFVLFAMNASWLSRIYRDIKS